MVEARFFNKIKELQRLIYSYIFVNGAISHGASGAHPGASETRPGAEEAHFRVSLLYSEPPWFFGEHERLCG
jgi:hypothetical protein